MRPEQGQEKHNKPSLSLPEVSLEKQVNTLEKPTGGISESTLSIKGQLEQIKQQQSIPESDLPRTQFTSDALLAATRKYAHVLKNLGKETFYHALIKRDPVLVDEHITLLVDNEVQVAYINPNLQEFMDFLKAELKNGFITIEVTVTEQSEQDNKPVTGKDKYQALARKNPNIHTLKNRFNLDIEF